MQLKIILNRVLKHSAFVYVAERLVETLAGATLEVQLRARANSRPRCSGCGRPVQDRLSRILQAIWEPEFCDCSFGFRPGRSAHDALRRVAEVITNEGTQWVVEADIKGFLDAVS